MKNWRQTLNDLTRFPYVCSEKHRALIRTHGASRTKAIDYIESVGGYIGHNERYPLSWSAKVYNVDLDAEALYSHNAREDYAHIRKLCSNDGERGVLYALFGDVYGDLEQTLFEQATADAWRNFDEDENRFGWPSAYHFDFGLTGRSGGNLVLTGMDGPLHCTNEDWVETFRERDPNDRNRYVRSHRYVAEAFMLALQISEDWPRLKIAEEVQWHAADIVWSRVSRDELVTLLEKYRHCKDPLDYLKEQL